LFAALDVGLRLAGELLVAGLFFGDVFGVVSRVAGELAVVELQDGTCDRVQEVSVVRDDEDGGLGVLDEVLQPLYGAQVQVVGRLVEEDEIRLGEEEAGQGDAALLASGEGAYGALPVRGIEAQRREGGGRSRPVLVATVPLELGLLAPVALQEPGRGVVGELRFQGLQLFLATDEVLES
jgi:hypothetical protein